MDRQGTLFDLDRYAGESELRWGWLDEEVPPRTELGTKNLSVPNPPLPELGTKDLLVPNPPLPELGTKDLLVPNSPIRRWDEPIPDNWKPPIGCLQRKWVKDHQYWYWRYYDNRRKKRSVYLGKDYNKSVAKAIKIGVPTDAKPLKRPASDPQTQTPTNHPVILTANTSTADPAPPTARSC
jgi:hypothetical protein